jgi:general secretion pathway protein L
VAETILIHLHEPDLGHVSWYPVGTNPSPLAPRGEGTLSEAAEKLKGWRLVASVSASNMLLTQVAIPSKNKQRLIQAVPFALENDLTEEIENLHFAVDAKSTDEATPVAVISREKLDGWLEMLQAKNLRPLCLFPDALCLPWTQGEWTVLLDCDRALVRSGQNSGFSSEMEDLPGLLPLAIAEARVKPQRLLVIQEADIPDSQVAALLAGLDIESRVVPLETSPSQLLAKHLDEKHLLNLLQGDYKQLDRKAVQWRRWLPAAALFSLLFLLNLGASLIDQAHYKAQSERLHEEIRQVYREAFPQSKRIVDPRVQMEQQLKLLRKGQGVSQGSFLTLIAEPAAAISKLKSGQLDSISYRDGQLDLKLTLKELQALERLKQEIEGQGLSVEIKSANASGNQVTSHLRIREGGS